MEKTFVENIISLNTAQLGSFGEFLFVYAIRENHTVKRLHDDRADFIVDGEKIDVKTTARDINRAPVALKPYSGTRINGVKYARVEFFETGARVSLEDYKLAEYDQDELKRLWQKWSNGEVKSLPAGNREKKKRLIESIRQEIEQYFSDKGITTRVIIRTCEKGFGKESPHNLKPSKILPRNATIYLSFNDERISRENLFRIIAFPDSHANRLPMLGKTALHLPKVDLSKIQKEYVFRNIEDLKDSYFERFKN